MHAEQPQALLPSLRDTTGLKARPWVVIVVDDDRVARQTTAAVLRQEGLVALEAESGQAALEMMAGARVGALLVDQSMPGMSGLDLTRLIRMSPEHRLVPILFMSADDRPEVRVAALRAGANDFMVKPVHPVEMAARVVGQMENAAAWAAKVTDLEVRTETLAGVLALTPNGDPVTTAKTICARLSKAHADRAVAVFGWDINDNHLEAVVGQGSVLASMATDPGFVLAARAMEPAWLQSIDAGRPSGPVTAACASLVARGRPIGVLAIEAQSAEATATLAAVLDYAAGVSLQIGDGLDGQHTHNRQRHSVEAVLSGQRYHSVFQPVIDLRDGSVIGHEALGRLDSGEPIPAFLIRAEEAGMKADCEIALVRSALEAAPAVRQGWVSVNLSPSVITNETERLAEALRDSTVDDLIIELTENEPIDDYAAVRRAIAGLGPKVRLSVDDAGSGYASLRHVLDLRPQFLKLDRVWVSGIESDLVRQSLVAGLVAFCDRSPTALIAEGIETEEERAMLERIGVGLGQGYLLGRPSPDGRPAATASH